MSEFESLGLRGGIWQGVVQRAAPPGRLLLIHAGRRVAEARVTPEGEGRWRVAIAIPAERLSDGVQTFLLLEDPADSDGAQPAPDAVQLAHLTLIAGEMADTDLRAELDLLRSELDLVKRELRRLARD
ncbi:MAG: hypothetical protein KA156_02010 [Paracoccus sp.]|nr:hypothetical protein [Paracoccus sp. (in: a-proteobacteria)]